jgi:hypothetical protein
MPVSCQNYFTLLNGSCPQGDDRLYRAIQLKIGLIIRVQLTHLPVLDHGPLEALHIYAQGRQCREEDDGLDANLLALIVLRLSRPA